MTREWDKAFACLEDAKERYSGLENFWKAFEIEQTEIELLRDKGDVDIAEVKLAKLNWKATETPKTAYEISVLAFFHTLWGHIHFGNADYPEAISAHITSGETTLKAEMIGYSLKSFQRALIVARGIDDKPMVAYLEERLKSLEA